MPTAEARPGGTRPSTEATRGVAAAPNRFAAEDAGDEPAGAQQHKYLRGLEATRAFFGVKLRLNRGVHRA